MLNTVVMICKNAFFCIELNFLIHFFKFYKNKSILVIFENYFESNYLFALNFFLTDKKSG